MKSIAPRVLAILVASIIPALSHAEDKLTENDLIGDWVFPENGSVIRAYRCGDGFCGKIVKVMDPSRRDIHNPDPKLRGRPVVGLVIFTSQYKKGPTTWRGKLYNTLDGSTYEGTLNIIDKGRVTLVGCLFAELICDARTFLRAGTPNAGQRQTASPPQRAISPDRIEVAAPTVPAAKPRPVIAAPREPSRADFDAFLAARGTTPAAIRTDQQRQALFKDFMTWWARR